MMQMLEIELVGAEADFEAIGRLLTAAFAFMDGRIDPPSSLHRLTPADLASKADAHGCLVARIEEDLVGCLFIEDKGDALYLEKLAVSLDRRNAGIGKSLVQSASMVAQSLGRNRLRLQTRIELVENHAAFEAMGFEKIAETAHPGYDRPTSIIMEKSL